MVQPRRTKRRAERESKRRDLQKKSTWKINLGELELADLNWSIEIKFKINFINNTFEIISHQVG